jgi:hypothetical protein
MNVDRTARNTNMLLWHHELWLIDHGACLYFHHAWDDWREKAVGPFSLIKNHVLLSQASMLDEADPAFRAILTDKVLQQIVALVPEAWLGCETVFENTAAHRSAYVEFLTTRVAHSQIFVKAAQDARAALI